MIKVNNHNKIHTQKDSNLLKKYINKYNNNYKIIKRASPKGRTSNTSYLSLYFTSQYSSTSLHFSPQEVGSQNRHLMTGAKPGFTAVWNVSCKEVIYLLFPSDINLKAPCPLGVLERVLAEMDCCPEEAVVYSYFD